jgi:uncharacterized membrane-anchored protein
MKHILGGVFVGALVSGLIAAVIVPSLPAAERRPWIVWLIVAITIAGTLFLRRRRGAKAPPGAPGE